MNGSQTSLYFDMPPPTFEEWVAQGSQAHPIPDNSIFIPNFVAPAFDSDDDDSDDD